MEEGEIVDDSPVKPSPPARRGADAGAGRRGAGRRRQLSGSEADRSPSLLRPRWLALSPLSGRGRRGRGGRPDSTAWQWTPAGRDRPELRRLSLPGRSERRGKLGALAERRRRRRELAGSYRPSSSPPVSAGSDDDRPARRDSESARRRSQSGHREERRRSRSGHREEERQQEEADGQLFAPPDRPSVSPPGLTGHKERRLGRYLDAFINNETYCEDSVSRVEPPAGADRGAPVPAAAESPPAAGAGVSQATARRRRRRPVRLGDGDGVTLAVAANAPDCGRRSESPDTLEQLARQAEGFAAPDLSCEDSEMSLLSFCR